MGKTLEKIHEKDANSLTKLQTQQSRKTYAGYMLIMMSLLSIVRCLDEFASSVGMTICSNTTSLITFLMGSALITFSGEIYIRS